MFLGFLGSICLKLKYNYFTYRNVPPGEPPPEESWNFFGGRGVAANSHHAIKILLNYYTYMEGKKIEKLFQIKLKTSNEPLKVFSQFSLIIYVDIRSPFLTVKIQNGNLLDVKSEWGALSLFLQNRGKVFLDVEIISLNYLKYLNKECWRYYVLKLI